jgi:hypothetical protein
MAVDSANGLNYFLSLPAQHKDLLYSIRHWQNLKIAFDEDLVWVKELNFFQVNSIEVKSIPFKELYYLSENRLFPKGSLLPGTNVPSLLWTPIERGLPIERPSYNHNYFGITEKIKIRLKPSEKEQEAFGLLVSMDTLSAYLETAPAIRLKNLSWVLIDDNSLILGFPLLPLQGSVYWRRDNFLLPVGFDFEFPILSDVINNFLSDDSNYWVVWSAENRFLKINKQSLKPLSISSFRLSTT